jgi:hypothetical protein
VVIVDHAGAGKSRSAPGGVLNPDGEYVCSVNPVGSQMFVYTIDLAASGYN